MFSILHSGGLKQSGEPHPPSLQKWSPSLTGPRPTMIMNASKTCPCFPESMNKCILPTQALTAFAVHMALIGMPMNSQWLRRLEFLRQLNAINRSRIFCRPEAPTLKEKVRHFEDFHRMVLTPSLPKISSSQWHVIFSLWRLILHAVQPNQI
jgi:hypothetical protein